jgi:aminopeptidase N
MGLEKFIEALRAYAERGQYRLMTGEDFFAVVTEYSPVDLNPLIEEYFPNR